MPIALRFHFDTGQDRPMDTYIRTSDYFLTSGYNTLFKLKEIICYIILILIEGIQVALHN